MKTKEIREIILKELPTIIKQDKEVQYLILHLSKEYFADKDKTEDRFDKILKDSLKIEKHKIGNGWNKLNCGKKIRRSFGKSYR